MMATAFYESPEFYIQHHWLLRLKQSLYYFCISITDNLDFLQATITYLSVIFLFNSSPFFIQVSLSWAGQGSVQLRAPAQKKSPNHLTRSTRLLRLFAFRVDRQLHFTGIILDGNVLIIPVNCQRSTLSSIISDSFEFLLAASTHKFHRR